MPSALLPRLERKKTVIEAAREVLGDRGSFKGAAFDLCLLPGLSKALADSHFGSSNGLVAAAEGLGDERTVSLRDQPESHIESDAFDSLMAFSKTQAFWPRAHPGLAMVLNFAHTAARRGVDVDSMIEGRLSNASNRNPSSLVGSSAPPGGRPTTTTQAVWPQSSR